MCWGWGCMGEVGSTDLGGEPVGSCLGISVNRITETRHRHHAHTSGPNGDTIHTSTAIPSHTALLSHQTWRTLAS